MPTISGIWFDKIGTVRVMAVVDGYVVAQRDGCLPFVTHWEYFVKDFSQVAE